MPTSTGLPMPGDYIVDATNKRWKVLSRDTNTRNCSVRVEDSSRPSGFRTLTEVMWWIEKGRLKLEGKKQ